MASAPDRTDGQGRVVVCGAAGYLGALTVAALSDLTPGRMITGVDQVVGRAQARGIDQV